MSERARSFDRVAAEYERRRPEYPPAAIGWAADRLGLSRGSRVLDVGAGTGKLSRGLVAAGFEVVAVEPGAPMREQLRRAVPEVDAREGSAEALPLPDGTVDAAFAGQAYHWFDPARALPELQRTIRPGGGLALLWNWWDVRDPLQQRLAHEIFDFDGRPNFGELPAPPWFEEVERTAVESTPETTPDALVARLATSSRLLVAEPAERERLLAGIGELASEYGERFPLPQLTYAYVFRRLS